MPEIELLPANDALSLEYQRDYGSAFRDYEISDLVNDPRASGVCSVFGLGFEEESLDLFLGQLRPLFDDGADPLLVSEQSIQPFAE